MRPVPLIHQLLPSLAPSPWLPLALQPPGASSLSLSLPWMGPPAGPLPPRTQPYGAHPPRRVTGWSRGSAHSSPTGGHPGRGFSPGRKGLGPGTHRAQHTHRGTALSPWKPSAWHLPLRPPSVQPWVVSHGGGRSSSLCPICINQSQKPHPSHHGHVRTWPGEVGDRPQERAVQAAVMT